MTPTSSQRSTTSQAFLVQAALSFGVATIALGLGIAYLPVNGWCRALIAVAGLYAVTSTFSLAKCVRDVQEAAKVTERLEQARVDRLLAEHEAFSSASPL